VGRAEELDQLADSLLPAEPTAVAITAIEGMAGVGKSYLADHFAMVHEDRFGDYLVLPIDPLSPQSPESLVAVLADRLKTPAAINDVRAMIRAGRALIHLENVDSWEAAKTAAALISQLPGCAIMLTGRMEGIGRGFGRIISLKPFSVEEGVRQLAEELAFLNAPPVSDADARKLVSALAGLPLAIHLAVGYLAAGFTPEEFLENLESACLALEPENPMEAGLSRDAQRLILSSTFNLSLDVLSQRNPAHAAAFPALSHMPAAGFGAGLGAAAMGVEATAARGVFETARKLSLLEKLRVNPDDPPRWRMHPLLASHLREQVDSEVVFERISAWFMERLPEPDGDEYALWLELNAEHAALGQWLRRMPADKAAAEVIANTQYGINNGPWPAWASFCEGLLSNEPSDDIKSKALWLMGCCQIRLGQIDEALKAAEAKAAVEKDRDNDREFALARSLSADIYQARGELDEALRIRREEELPVYERLGDVRSLLVGRANLALLCLEMTPPQRNEANILLCQALAAARRMNIPEANIIQQILDANEMTCENEGHSSQAS
jgi:tetratricopeptide (TPR) repeat protein